MAGSAALTSDSTGYAHRKKHEDVWEQAWRFTFASGDSTEVKQAINLNGILRRIFVVCSGASGAVVTATVAIDDNGDREIFSVSALAESTTYNYVVDEPLSGAIDVGVLPSTDPLSAYTVDVVLRGI